MGSATGGRDGGDASPNQKVEGTSCLISPTNHGGWTVAVIVPALKRVLHFNACLFLAGCRESCLTTWPLKKHGVLIFGAALGFSNYSVRLMPIGTILSKNRSISWSAASARKFSCFGPYANSGNGGLYIRVVLFVLTTFWKRSVSSPSDAVFNSDHDKVIKFTFSKKCLRRHFWSNNNIGGQKLQNVKTITSRCYNKIIK